MTTRNARSVLPPTPCGRRSPEAEGRRIAFNARWGQFHRAPKRRDAGTAQNAGWPKTPVARTSELSSTRSSETSRHYKDRNPVRSAASSPGAGWRARTAATTRTPLQQAHLRRRASPAGSADQHKRTAVNPMPACFLLPNRRPPRLGRRDVERVRSGDRLAPLEPLLQGTGRQCGVRARLSRWAGARGRPCADQGIHLAESQVPTRSLRSRAPTRRRTQAAQRPQPLPNAAGLPADGPLRFAGERSG